MIFRSIIIRKMKKNGPDPFFRHLFASVVALMDSIGDKSINFTPVVIYITFLEIIM